MPIYLLSYSSDCSSVERGIKANNIDGARAIVKMQADAFASRYRPIENPTLFLFKQKGNVREYMGCVKSGLNDYGDGWCSYWYPANSKRARGYHIKEDGSLGQREL